MSSVFIAPAEQANRPLILMRPMLVREPVTFYIAPTDKLTCITGPLCGKEPAPPLTRHKINTISEEL